MLRKPFLNRAIPPRDTPQLTQAPTDEEPSDSLVHEPSHHRNACPKYLAIAQRTFYGGKKEPE